MSSLKSEIELFIRFINATGNKDKYIAAVKKADATKRFEKIKDFEMSVENMANMIASNTQSAVSILRCSFVWSLTEDGEDFWNTLNKKWYTVIDQYGLMSCYIFDYPVKAFLHFLEQIGCLDDFLRESADFTELVTRESVINRLNRLHPTDYVLASLAFGTSHKGPEFWTAVHNSWLEISKTVIMFNRTEQ